MEEMTQPEMTIGGSYVLSGIRSEDHHLFRVYKAYTSEARLALLQVLSWGCPKAPSQTFHQYLTASGLSSTSYRKAFNSQQKDKISTNPSGDRFDISLLYKMIQMACHSLAPPEDRVWTVPNNTRLEYLLTRIKNARNGLVHDASVITQEKMVEEIQTLRDLLTKVVEISGALYCVNNSAVEQVLRRIHYDLNNVRDQPFAPLDLEDYSNHLLFDSLRATLRLNGAKELKQAYGSKIFLNPLSFLDKNECHLQVGAVFICLSIQDLRASTRCRLVHCKELLEHIYTTTPADVLDGSQRVEHEAQNLSLMVLEGQPGSGKTTLLRFYISEWIAGGGDIKGLSDYDLVLHFECRNTCIDSFTQLLISHMPQSTSKFRISDLMHIFLSLKTMVLIDGLDELNLASQKVFKEILRLKSSCDLTLICTSRAEKIREVHKLASFRGKVVHMKLQGIPIEKREEFVRAYHCQLRKYGVSKHDIGGLIDYLRQVPSHLQDFFRFPLNLVLLTFLWDGAHPIVRNITTMTALYLETHKLLTEKLLERLMYHPSTQHLPLAKLISKCDSFRAVMYEEALRALAAGVVYLNGKATKKLREHCASLDLPAEEMFSAFLVSASYEHTLALSEEVKFPHKDIQDFYAAKHVTSLVKEDSCPDLSRFISRLDELLRESSVPAFAWRQMVKHTRELLGQPVSIRSVLLEFHEDHAQTRDLGRYQNTIFHLVNLLHSSAGQQTLDHYAAEVVTLLAAAKGMSFEHWVDVLKESHYNPTLAQEISKVLPKFSWAVRDQHVKAAAIFLSHSCPSQLAIDIMNDPEQVPHLNDLLETAATCSCKIYLFFHHHWRRPETGLSNSLLLKLVATGERDSSAASHSSTSSLDYLPSDCIRSRVAAASGGLKIRLVEVMGRFSGQTVHMLPSSIKELHLAIADDHDALDWFETLPKLSDTLPSLRNIWLHVTVGVCPDLLPSLPKLLYRPRLYLSSVGDDNISWASRVARALLLPNAKYASVGLVRSSLSSRGVSQLAELLHHVGVGVYAGRGGGLLVASTHLSDSDFQNVSDTVLRYLRCPFALFNDDEIWYDESIYEEVYEYLWCEKRRDMTQDPAGASSIASRNDTSSQHIYEFCKDQEEAVYNNFRKTSSMTILKESNGLYVDALVGAHDNNLESSSTIYECIEDVTGPQVPSLPPRHPPVTLRKSSYASVHDDLELEAHRQTKPPPLPSRTDILPPKPDTRLSERRISLSDPSRHNIQRPRAPLPNLWKPSSLRPQLDQSYGKPVIPPRLNLANPHLQQKPYIPKPVIPCPLTPRFQTRQPHSLDISSSDND